jgi:hypothetical protein
MKPKPSIRALTPTEPSAWLVALGFKGFETRSWQTVYRGPLAIHAAKSFPRWAQDHCYEEPFRSCLLRAGIGLWGRTPANVIVEGLLLGAGDELLVALPVAAHTVYMEFNNEPDIGVQERNLPPPAEIAISTHLLGAARER